MSIKDVSVGAWVLLSVIVASLTAIVIFAPPTMWDALGKADWPHVAGVIGLVGSALVGVFVEWRKASVKAGPLVLLLAASLTAGMASGCGASAVRTHYDTLAVVGQVFDAATDGAEAALTTQAAACSGDDACLDGVRDAWRPVQVAQGAVLLALQSWASALGLWEAAGDHPAFVRAAIRTLDAVGSGWNTWAASGAAVGWTLPAIPPDLLTMARAVGGE